MAAPQDPQPLLAVLIDADNAQPAIIEGLLAEVARLGVASVKRIYGDWTTPNLGGWKPVLLAHSIQPIQQFRYTTGKNATDSAMIIDAMDLLYAQRLDGFCLVSSDSDFTRLAARLRESGRRVYGFGENKTPRPFVSACDRFTYTEVFAARPAAEGGAPAALPIPRRTEKELRCDTALMNPLRAAIEACADEEGWAQLSQVGSHLGKTATDFDSRNYGFPRLSELIAAIGLFEVARRDNRIYVRDTRRKPGG